MMHFIFFPLFLLFTFSKSEAAVFDQKINYPLKKTSIDVIIPSVEKDLNTLDLAISGIKANGIGVQKIIVVSANPLTSKADWCSETSYPFTKKDIANVLFKGNEVEIESYLNHPNSRIGWIYQQLIKLYAFKVIPNLSENILILDSDTIFLSPVEFQNEDGWPLFNTGIEYHPPYFEHAKKLLPGLHKVYSEYSGISHHMLFQRVVLEDLFSIVESIHQKPFWQVFCENIDKAHFFHSGASEYEIYFNFFILRSDQYSLRKLKWLNGYLKRLSFYKKTKALDYVSCHQFDQS